MKKIWQHINDPKFDVIFFRLFALALVVLILYLLFTNWEKNISLLAALGILISALLASSSVTLGIDTTIKIKQREIQDKVRETFFELCQIKMLLLTLKHEHKVSKISYGDFTRQINIMQRLKELSYGTQNKKITSTIHNTVLSDLYFLYLQIDMNEIYLKSLFQNVQKPAFAKIHEQIFPNPLQSLNLKIDKSLTQVTSILTYLKEGYSQYFPEKGGIEQCAQYKSFKEKSESDESTN